ncbi:MAG: hypothetical protein R3F20_11195 [Planctomycetota bacterium]
MTPKMFLLPVALVVVGAWLLWPADEDDDYVDDTDYSESGPSRFEGDTELQRYLATRGIKDANFIKPGWTPEAEAEVWRERTRQRTVAPTDSEVESAPDHVARPDEIRRAAPDAVEIR